MPHINLSAKASALPGASLCVNGDDRIIRKHRLN